MKILLYLLLFTSSLFQSQNFKSEYIQIDSTSFNKLNNFGIAKSWISHNFKSGEAVIDMEDKDLGRIIGNGKIIKVVKSPFGNQVGLDIISFQINIDVKDNKYRLLINKFNHDYIQQASTYIPGNTILSSMNKNITNSRNGGSLDNEKPICGTMKISKKQWAEIKNFTDEKINYLFNNFKEYIKAQSIENGNW